MSTAVNLVTMMMSDTLLNAVDAPISVKVKSISKPPVGADKGDAAPPDWVADVVRSFVQSSTSADGRDSWGWGDSGTDCGGHWVYSP